MVKTESKYYFIVTIHNDNTFTLAKDKNRPVKEKHLAKKNLENIKRIINENLTYKSLNQNDPYAAMEKSKLIGILEKESNYIKDRFNDKFKTTPWVVRIFK